jgi:hypothetical protein
VQENATLVEIVREAMLRAAFQEKFMRMLMRVTMNTEKFNAAVRDGTASAKMQRILGEMKAEAVYFTEFDGKRTGILIVDLKDASQIPAFAEPWFLTFEAGVEFHPAMLPEDLVKSGIEGMGKKW